MPSAGDLRERVHFQSRELIDDGYGNEQSGPWTTRFTVAAGFRPLRGGEAVMASRLESRQPYIVTVHQSSDTRGVTTDWRIVDARNTGRVFAISAAPTDPDGKRAWLEILAIEGMPS